MLRNSVLRSSMLLALAACTLTGGLAMQAAHADVYKYTDSKGVVQYTDKPPVLPAERLGLQSQKTDEAATQARTQAELKRAQDSANSQQKGAEDQKDKKTAAELTATDKAERCAKARERYDKYMNSRRMYKDNGGERQYLSDAELDSARNDAKTSMDELCK